MLVARACSEASMGSVLSLQRNLACSCLVAVAWLAVGCGELLGISEPVPRGGASGGDAIGGSSSKQGDDAGASGEGGTPGAAGDTNGPCPVLGATQCSGQEPQVCTGDGWLANEAENGGLACPELCVAGQCAECSGTEQRCNDNTAQRCEHGAWANKQDCAAYCLEGACVNPPSCQLARTCGDGASCCRSLVVPGGSFIRDYDANEFLSTDYTATVSPFLLDRFEVTVSRFTSFVNAYDELKLEAGAGKSPHIPGDKGWQPDYPVPKSSAAVEDSLACFGATWDHKQGLNRGLPINCVSLYLAYEFCVWDGGRLPTEAEWNFAAAGGDEQREYPWSTPTNSGLDANHAVYGFSTGLPQEVGTKLLGNARWGQSDLAGNVGEWTLDYFSSLYPSSECNDCLDTTEQPTRAVRGGGYRFNASTQKVAVRRAFESGSSLPYIGFRCARDLPPTPKQMVNQ